MRTRIQAGRSWASGLQGIGCSAFRRLDQLEQGAVGVGEAREAAVVGLLDLAEELHAAADQAADHRVELVRFDAHHDAGLLEEVTPAGARSGAALDAQLELVAAGPEAVGVTLDLHLEPGTVEDRRGVEGRREDGDAAAHGHGRSPTGSASRSSSKTSCKPRSTGSRASPTDTGRPSSRASEVKRASPRPQASKRSKALKSGSTLRAKPWVTTQRSARMPSEASFRS